MGVRLVPQQPKKLRRREAGHGQNARDLADTRFGREHVGTFGGGPRIVPQDGRTHRLVSRRQAGRHRASGQTGRSRGLARAAAAAVRRWPRGSPPTKTAGSCSLAPLNGVRTVSGADPVASTSPPMPMTQVFTADVPRSMPRYMVMTLQRREPIAAFHTGMACARLRADPASARSQPARHGRCKKKTLLASYFEGLLECDLDRTGRPARNNVKGPCHERAKDQETWKSSPR